MLCILERLFVTYCQTTKETGISQIETMTELMTFYLLDTRIVSV